MALKTHLGVSLKEALDFRDELVRVFAVRRKLHDVALAIDQVLEKVPLDLVIWALALHVRVERARVVALDVDLAKEREVHAKSRSDPVADLLLLPRFLGTELVAGAGQDL